MKKFVTQQAGQGLVELLCSLVVLLLVLNGLVQLLLIASAQLRLEWASRRYVWLQSRSNYAGFQIQQAQAIAGYPLETVRYSTGSSHTSPAAYGFSIQVPAIGFVRMLKPQGFSLKTRQAIFAYVEPNPIQPGKWLESGFKLFSDWIAGKKE